MKTTYYIAIAAIMAELSRLMLPNISQLLFFIASFLVLVMSIQIRFTTKPEVANLAGETLQMRRFANFMPVAALFCFIADVLLPIDFVWGMLAFIFAHFAFMTAYTGIIKFTKITTKQLLPTLSGTLAILFAYAGIIYFGFIYNPADVMTIIVFPYLVILLSMAFFTFINYSYPRPQNFRLSLLFGAVLFVISDSILAIDKFAFTIPAATQIIGGTYILAIILLQLTPIFATHSS